MTINAGRKGAQGVGILIDTGKVQGKKKKASKLEELDKTFTRSFGRGSCHCLKASGNASYSADNCAFAWRQQALST